MIPTQTQAVGARTPARPARLALAQSCQVDVSVSAHVGPCPWPRTTREPAAHRHRPALTGSTHGMALSARAAVPAPGPRLSPLVTTRWRCQHIKAYDANVRSTNPTVQIDSSSLVPLHEQVAAAIRRAIADGEAGPGERLPPARDLAAVLGVNANTVFRALRTLREEGLVEFRRGRGVSVTASAAQRSPVVTKARELVAVARRYGYRPEELAAIIEQVS